MMSLMSVRHVFLASVSAVFLAASAAVSGSAGAATENPNLALTQSAYQSLNSGDASGAITAYTKAIESRGLETEVLANALLNRALAFQRLNQQQQAIDDYTAALRLDAMSGELRAMALYNRALSYQKVARPALAVEDYTSALFLNASFSYAYYGRANLLRDSGQYLFALADYDKALQYKYPDPARVYYGQALTYEVLQRPQNMRQSLAQALAANPQFAPAQQKLASLDSNQQPADTDSGLITASVNTGGTLVARKSILPAAEQPSQALLGDDTASVSDAPAQQDTAVAAADPAPPSKKIIDRVPVAPEATAAVDQPTEEKVIAIEPVTEDSVAASADAAPAAPEDTATAAATPDTSATATAVADTAPVQTGWSVQIASAGSEDAAWSTFKKLQKSHRVLSDKTPIVVKADLGSKGTFYRVRLTGYDKQDQAKSACSKLRSGGVSCYVSKADS
jgi:tetratricopeptide (TPR) repeat protein